MPERKPNRLENFDYSAAGAYFITICTHRRRKILSQIRVGEAICLPQDQNCILHLTEWGKTVRRAIDNISNVYPSVTVDSYVIMPNHVHLILRIEHPEGGRQVASPTISTIVGNMKWTVSKTIGQGIWQRSFHDHVIRDGKDYNKIADYIAANPMNWELDCFYSEAEEL
ncbi:MAG: transposase [Clostridia bacterium]|nr:transposase [Clostridia bacterium]